MLSVRTGLKDTNTSSVRAMQAALAPKRSSVRELLQVDLIHQLYLRHGGRLGPLGFPVAEVQTAGLTATRDFRGGVINVLENGSAVGFRNRQFRVVFIGFRCLQAQAGPGSDEPYFIIGVDQYDGRPVTNTFRFEGVDEGTVITVSSQLVSELTPNPTAIRVVAYEEDQGDPEETAANLQETFVKLSNEASKLASAAAANAADGSGIGPTAAASTVGGVLAGPIGALIAAGIVEALDLGDDFVGESARELFSRSDQAVSPPILGTVEGQEFNVRFEINGGDNGRYELFFLVLVTPIPNPLPPIF